MAWNSVSPDGTKSVKLNKTIIQANTTYTEATLNKDHFWNIGVNEDGRHKFAQMPKTVVGGLPSDAILAAGMDLVTYAKENNDIQGYIRNNNSVMQLLGMRSCGLFTGAGGLLYSHNVLALARTAAGSYTITFHVANPMPSNNYFILVGAMRNDAVAHHNIYAIVDSANNVATVKRTTGFDMHTVDTSANRLDPLQAWFICFGG